MNVGNKAGHYAAELQVAYARAGIIGWLLPVAWFFFPLALQTVLHPTDAVGFLHVLHGEPVPRQFTARMWIVGELYAAITIAVVILVQLVGTVLFYRRVHLELKSGAVAGPALWPIAGILVGIIGNALWWIGTRYFDFTGCLVGMTALALTVGCEVVCEMLGRSFVFGPGQQPKLNPWPIMGA